MWRTLLILLFAWPALAHEHGDVRRFVIQSQLAQAGSSTVVLIGDSITESALLPSTVCGRTLINAGVGGTTAASYLNSVLSGIPQFKSDTVVIALGTNDARANNARFREDYERLIGILKDYSPSLLIAGLPTVGEKFDQELKSIADRHAMSFIPLRQENEGLTVDGIHLSPKGYLIWTQAIISRIKASLQC